MLARSQETTCKGVYFSWVATPQAFFKHFASTLRTPFLQNVSSEL